MYTNLGYEVKKPVLDVSWLTNFRTQFDRSFNLPNDSVYVSKFMAPAYLQSALGIDYHPFESLEVLVAPVSGKYTFVSDTRLANNGAFGMQTAERDSAGNMITPGKKFRAELSAFIKILYSQN